MTLWRYLRQPKRRSKQRAHAKSAGLGKIPHRVGIEHRLAEVDDRLVISHWEGDTVLRGYKQSGLVTMVERRSGYLMAARLLKITSELTEKAMIRLLKPRLRAVKSITLDNGSKLACHEGAAKAVAHQFISVMPTARDNETPEPPRLYRRLHILRGWSYELTKTIFPRSPGASCSISP